MAVLDICQGESLVKKCSQKSHVYVKPPVFGVIAK